MAAWTFLGYKMSNYSVEDYWPGQTTEDNVDGIQKTVTSGKHLVVVSFVLRQGLSTGGDGGGYPEAGGRMLARVRAHRLKHKQSVKFDVPIRQELGVSVPTRTVRLTHDAAADQNKIRVDRADQLVHGMYLAFPGHRKIYSISDMSGTDIEVEPNLQEAASRNDVLDFEPMARMVWHSQARQRYVYSGRVVVGIQCTFKEQA